MTAQTPTHASLPEVPLATAAPSGFVRYAGAVLLTVAAMGATQLLGSFLGPMRLFFYWVAVFLAAMLGLGPAIVATVLSAAGISWFIFSPASSLLVRDTADILRLLLFVAFAGGIAAIVGQRNNSQRRAAALADWLATTLRSIGDGVVAADAEMRVVFLNEAAESITGWTSAEAKGRLLGEVVSITDGSELKSKDGTHVPVEHNAAPIVASGGAILGTVVVFRDATDGQRRARETEFLSRASALLGSSLDMETTLRALAHACVPELADWCAIDMAREGAPYVRVAVEHTDPVKKRLAYDLDRRYRVRPENDPVVACLTTGKPRLISEISDEILVGLARDEEHLRIGRSLGLESLLMVPMISRGRTLGVISLIAAESGRRYTEDDLPMMEELAHRAATAIDHAQMYREAERANRAKDEFLATLSHELRTPLTAIVGWANMLQMGDMDQQTMTLAINTIARSAKTQGELIDDLLDVSRVIAGKLELKLERVDLAAIVKDVIDAASPAAQSKRVEMRMQAPPVLVVRGDPRRLAQVTWNLVSNAVKFTQPGGRVEVTVSRAGSNARIEVKDTGQGIEPQFMPYVWERFRQADSTASRQHGGLGLGLALVRHLIEMHGGVARAESPGSGGGSVFTVEMPLPDDSAVGIPATTPLNEQTLQGRHILVVDDDDDARQVIASMLRLFGARVTAAATAEEALLTKERCDGVVTDLAMPGQDGYALLRQLRADGRWQGVPVVALSAMGGIESRSRAMDAGFDEFLEKPIEATVLASTMQRMVSSAPPR